MHFFFPNSFSHFTGDLLGLPLLPAFATTFSGGRDILSGVNYASAAAGILDESGQFLVMSSPIQKVP